MHSLHLVVSYLFFSTSGADPPLDSRENLSALSKDFDVYVRDFTPTGLSDKSSVVAIRYRKSKDPEDS